MQLEITETSTVARHGPSLLNLRWSAVFAGLAVGLATSLLLMLLGTAAGLSYFNLATPDTGANLPAVAAVWNTASMLIAAFIGGYVAARSSGLKRTSDGLLHAAVAWGMTLLLAVFLASAATGTTFDAMFPALQGRAVSNTAQLIDRIDQGDRAAAAASLQRNLGISAAQAQELVAQAMALSGHQEAAGEVGRDAAQNTLHTATVVSLWLSVSTVLSLLAAVGGGASGIRGSRRLPHRHIANLA